MNVYGRKLMNKIILLDFICLVTKKAQSSIIYQTCQQTSENYLVLLALADNG